MGGNSNVKFEQCILSILPNTIFIVLTLISSCPSLLKLLQSRFKPTSLPSRSILAKRFDILFGFKLLVGLMLVAGDAATLAGMGKIEWLKATGTTDAAYGIQLVSSIFLLFSALTSHHLSPSPSTPLILFALIRTLVGATQLRTFGLLDMQDGPTRGAFVALAVSTGAALGMMAAEVVEKRGLMDGDHQDLPKRTTSSFVVKPFFLHLIPLLHLGSHRKLLLSDLTSVPTHLLAQSAHSRLGAQLALGDRTQTKMFLLRATGRAFGRSFLKPVLPRALLMLATFGQVFLVQDITGFVEDKGTSDTRGWALVGGFIIIYTIIPVTTYLYWEAVFDVSVQYRSALVGSIYSKTLTLAMAATRSIGQGAAATYMSVDVERVTESLKVIHELWVAVLSIGIACALLWFQARWAMFAPLVVIVSFLAATSCFSAPVGRSQKVWMTLIDQRIKLLSSVVNQLLPIKLGGYEEVFEKKVSVIREKEVKALQKFYLLILGGATIANTGSTFAGLACIGAYALMQSRGVALDLGHLSVSRIFTILTIINLLSGPINVIGQALPEIAAAFVSLQRLCGFLLLPEKEKQVRGGSEESDEKTMGSALSVEKEERELGLISITDGTFAWEEENPVLKDITLELTPGKLHMLVGSVASGKTTLLMSLLGETIRQRGSVSMPSGRVAYCSQSPFVFPGTFRSNIVFDRPYDKEWFKTVIHACGLDPDIERLPNGEETKLGERGVTLSGGQRQRLALARAVYANTDILLLDDTFSALDGETETHVFKCLFGEDGLLKGKTVVLVTHALQHLPFADNLVVLHQGQVAHVGTYAQLQQIGAVIDVQKPTSDDDTTANVKNSTSGEEAESTAESDSGDEKGDESRKARWAALKFYCASIGFWTAIIFMTLLVLTNAITIGIQGFLQKFATSAGANLGVWVAGYGAMCSAYAITQSILLWQFSIYFIWNTCTFMHKAELDGVLRASFAYLQATPGGKILNRFSQDIQENDFRFPLSIINLAFNILTIIGSLIFFIMATPWLGLAFPILVPAYVYILRFYLATSTQLQHLEAGSKSPLYTLFSTTIAGLQNIRAYQAQEFFESQNKEILDTSQGPFFFRFEGQIFLTVILSWMTTLLAITMSIIAVALRHSTSASLLGVALLQLTGLGEKLTYGMASYAALENGLVSVQRIQEFADLLNEGPNPPMSITTGAAKPGAWLTKGEVEFRNYSMKYRDDLPPALKDLNLLIHPGQKIGICGRTGSGKSSMLLALFRAIQQDLVSGQILIDGWDTATISLAELRNSMCIVTQEPFLFRGDLRENIDIESNHTDEQIWAALDAVGMKDAVSSLPKKLDDELADEDSFSKGQRQLLCLARALLSNKKIIVLDESTSSMDHVTDERIRKVVEEQMRGVTVVAIAHRISSIIHYDKILLLSHGSLQEFDAPQTLLSRPESRFARLAGTQGIYRRASSRRDEGEGVVVGGGGEGSEGEGEGSEETV